jgi:hypothetical protein
MQFLSFPPYWSINLAAGVHFSNFDQSNFPPSRLGILCDSFLPLNIIGNGQCYGSVTYDPDPDSALFVSDLLDANKKYYFLKVHLHHSS